MSKQITIEFAGMRSRTVEPPDAWFTKLLQSRILYDRWAFQLPGIPDRLTNAGPLKDVDRYRLVKVNSGGAAGQHYHITMAAEKAYYRSFNPSGPPYRRAWHCLCNVPADNAAKWVKVSKEGPKTLAICVVCWQRFQDQTLGAGGNWDCPDWQAS